MNKDINLKNWSDITKEHFSEEIIKYEYNNDVVHFKMVNGRFVVIVKTNIKDALHISTMVSIAYQIHIEGIQGEHWDRVFIVALIPNTKITLEEKTEFEKDTFASNKFVIESEGQLEEVVLIHNSWMEATKLMIERHNLESEQILLSHKIN